MVLIIRCWNMEKSDKTTQKDLTLNRVECKDQATQKTMSTILNDNNQSTQKSSSTLDEASHCEGISDIENLQNLEMYVFN